MASDVPSTTMPIVVQMIQALREVNITQTPTHLMQLAEQAALDPNPKEAQRAMSEVRKAMVNHHQIRLAISGYFELCGDIFDRGFGAANAASLKAEMMAQAKGGLTEMEAMMLEGYQAHLLELMHQLLPSAVSDGSNSLGAEFGQLFGKGK